MTYTNTMNCCRPSDNKQIVKCGRPVLRAAFVTHLYHLYHMSPPTQTSFYGLFNVALTLFEVRELSEAWRPQGDVPWSSNNKEFYVLPTQCIYGFCVDLKTISDYFSIQH